MDSEIFENPYSPATQPSEDFFFSHGFGSVENPPPPPITTLDSLLSQLDNLSVRPLSQYPQPPLGLQNRRHYTLAQSSGAAATTPPFGGRQSALDAELSSSSYWAPISDGPSWYPWAHHEINVGSWANPYRDRLMNIHQRQDFFNLADSDHYYNAVLHGKEQILRNTIPILPFAQQQQGNFSASLYSNSHLYNWKPELTSSEFMRGRILSLANDQRLCNVLNATLDEGLSEQEIEMILPEVLEVGVDLLRNQFGSQFVQKLFAVCNEDQKDRIIFSLVSYPSKFMTMCVNTYGARGIQKLLEKLMTPQQISLVMSALVSCAFALSTDSNGQHVIQHCVKKFSNEYVEKLVIEIANHCYQIGTNKSGCCVIQACIENSSGEARKRLINEIVANAVHLAEDPYGNYVVQHLLGMNFPEATSDLMRQFQGRFVSLSCNKFASNVVEKFLMVAGESNSRMIIVELIQNGPTLFLDPYGNFVIQKALAVSNGRVFEYLKEMILENAASMQNNIYGKKVLEKLQKIKDSSHAWMCRD